MRGKLRQRAVARFWLNLERESYQLYHELRRRTYRHGRYFHFVMEDTKRRDIYVATVRDRIVHQIISEYLEAQWIPHFIAHSYAAQAGKGVHAARTHVLDSIAHARRVGAVFVAKLDVKQYFAFIDHSILLEILRRRTKDTEIMALIEQVIRSYGNGRGVPLGNLTSQWFGNIYLHELDWYALHPLHIRYYMRYNDDVIIIGNDQATLRTQMKLIQSFVAARLGLLIPEEKAYLIALPNPVDVLGWCTDGRKVWVRPATVARVERHLFQRADVLHRTMLETLCSYFANGIAIAPEYTEFFYDEW